MGYIGPNNILFQDSEKTIFEINSKKHGIFECVVDTEDFDLIKSQRWGCRKHNVCNYYYIRSHIKNDRGKIIYLHRLIMQVTDSNLCVDHINHNTLDNRKSNLRICSNRENLQSRRNITRSKSGYRGVRKYYKKYCARISIMGKQISLGYFNSPHLAAKAYNDAAIQHFGEFATLNILPDMPEVEE